MSTKKPWGGRFSQASDDLAERFTASVDFDRRLYRHDIAGSIAHARMLQRVGVLSAQECDAIVTGLAAVETEIRAGEFSWSQALEDVHMNIEARLVERIGEPGKKLHSGRSRNDQVATDVRLYLREAIDALCEVLASFQSALIDKAEQEADSIMPGFTHLQVAQPVTFGHHLLAWFEMLQRDHERLRDCRKRLNYSPLGAAALAGTSFPIDRESVAAELGFAGVAGNSLDAVSDRDFALEFVAAGAIFMIHLSRMAEELILWSSQPFAFVDLPEAFCTGSSIMPQKKNPDVAELVRGKSARVAGHLTGLLMLMKSQPLAYNRDNQEDKEPLFDTVDTVQACARIMADVVPALEVHRERMREAAAQGYSTATDLAEYLVRRGVAFRDAHEMVGKLVRRAIADDKALSELPLEVFREYSETVQADVFEVLTVEGSVRSRDHIGGTAPAQVRAAVAAARKRLAAITE